MFRTFLAVLAILSLASSLPAQQPPQQPKVKVNVLNVCTPSADEQQQIAAALAKVPKQPIFSTDFEVDRGQSNLEERPGFLQPGSGEQGSSDEPAIATWVRIRKEFAVQALFSTVQYSFSMDSKNMVETLVLHVREPKDLMEISLEDRASTVAAPSAMLTTSTPVTHIKLERFGKSSVVLARCPAPESGPAPDQSAYEPLFQSATSVMANYRGLLDVKRTVPDELERIGNTKPSVPQPAAKKAAPRPASKLRKPETPQR